MFSELTRKQSVAMAIYAALIFGTPVVWTCIAVAEGHRPLAVATNPSSLLPTH